MHKTYLGLLCASLLLIGCNSQDKDKVDSSSISVKSNISKKAIEASQKLDQTSYQGLEHLFKDTSSIKFDGKYVLVIFGKNNCQWCDKLKDDIKVSSSIQDQLKKSFDTYYINTSYSKTHQILYPDTKEEINTSTLARSFRVSATPTSVFFDPQGEAIFVLPGYLPPEHYSGLLNLISSGDYKDEAKRQAFFESLQS